MKIVFRAIMKCSELKKLHSHMVSPHLLRSPHSHPSKFSGDSFGSDDDDDDYDDEDDDEDIFFSI